MEILTKGTQRAYIGTHGSSIPRGPNLRKEDHMKIDLRAPACALKKNVHLQPSLSGGPGAPKAGTRQDQHRNGGIVRGHNRAAMAEVHVDGREQQTRHGIAHAVLRDGALGTGPSDPGPSFGADARSGRRGRLGRRAGGRLTRHQAEVLDIIRGALRAAVDTVSDRDGLDVAAAALVVVAELVRREVDHV